HCTALTGSACRRLFNPLRCAPASSRGNSDSNSGVCRVPARFLLRHDLIESQLADNADRVPVAG
ncbi:hypothetical protein, partial [Polaromonas sp.]|uniref:hypothetical protein n=1 Tax=Polaromonas sp. TaxID=1869339 RepID=UPI0025D78693